MCLIFSKASGTRKPFGWSVSGRRALLIRALLSQESEQNGEYDPCKPYALLSQRKANCGTRNHCESHSGSPPWLRLNSGQNRIWIKFEIWNVAIAGPLRHSNSLIKDHQRVRRHDLLVDRWQKGERERKNKKALLVMFACFLMNSFYTA